MVRTGRITKLVGGIYEVLSEEKTYLCKARGLFRKEGNSPLVGDMVTFEELEEASGYLHEILPRKNQLVRPPLANLDLLFLVVSVTDPKPNFRVLDYLIAIAEHKNIEPAIIITKKDLTENCDFSKIYRDAGFLVFETGFDDETDLANIHHAMRGKLSAFCGNTGVGKSTLLNRIDPRFEAATGETSKKLGRGKHTTRHVQLYPVENGGFIADTPGFSRVDLERYAVILKDEMAFCFREFAPYIKKCRFHDCSHTKEKDCAVIDAVASGEIAPSRYASYLDLYENARKINEWELSDRQKTNG